MMNKIYKFKYFIALLAIILTGVACEDALDQSPSNKVSIDRLLNKSSVVNFKDNAYNQLPKSFTAASAGVMLEAYSDDAFRAGEDKSFQWHNGLLSLSNTFFGETIWDDCWQGIRRCNLAIKYLPKEEVDDRYLDASDVERYLDEVKLLRAWYHFMLIKNFGPIPFIDQAYSPDYDGWKDLTRPSYDAIAKRIVEECDKIIAKNTLDIRRSNEEEYEFMNKAVAYALKSRVLLYNASPLNNSENDIAKWDAAAAAAQACIDALTPEYALVDIDDYATLFNESNLVYNKEIIYRSVTNNADLTNKSNGVDLQEYGAKDQSVNCGAVPTQELVDCFELKNGALPVTSYTNADHTAATFAPGYAESVGSNPYANRDARLAHTILYNGAYYGKMQGLDDSVIVYIYDGRVGSGFNAELIKQDDAFKRLSCTGYYTRKFRSANYWGTNTGGTNAHKIFFRLAEVYLNLAEAECERGELDKALAALNMVRERAGQPKLQDVPGYIESSQDFIRKRIRNERRVELCFEGHRYYDQRRWKILDSTNGAITGMKITSAGGDLGPFSYERVNLAIAPVERKAITDQYLIFPIDADEIQRLPSLGQPAAWQ